jgi:hypothetical protein
MWSGTLAKTSPKTHIATSLHIRNATLAVSLMEA